MQVHLVSQAWHKSLENSFYMKKNIFLSILSTVLAIVTLEGCSHHYIQKTGLEGKSMPAFNLFLADSTTFFNTAKIPSGQPVALFLFGPSCPYSRAEMTDILANIKDFKNIRIYAITTAQFPEMKSFYSYFQLQKYQNIIAGLDYTDFFANYFKATGVPYLAIYDGQKKLKEVFIGKRDIQDIKDVTSGLN